MVKAQKGSKNIVKMVHVTGSTVMLWSNENTFCVQRIQKQRLYLAILLLRVTVGAINESTTRHVSIPLLVNKAQHMHVLHQQHHKHASWYSR